MGFELPSPLLPKLLNGLLGQNGPGHGHGPGGVNGAGEGPENDPDNSAHHARQAALQNERAAEAGNDQGRWQQSEGANNDGVQRGNGHHEGHGPQGPGNSSSVGNGHFPEPGEILSDIVGKADAATRGLLGDGPPGLIAKSGDLAANLLNQAAQTTQAAAGLAAKSLEAMPLAGTATAASALLTQATAQALNAPGAQALAARNALHDAASGPVLPSRDIAAPLQTSTNPLQGNALIPGTSRTAETALLQGRQDLPMPMRAEQAVVDRSANTLPSSSPPPAAPAAADATRSLPFSAPPSTVPPSQSAAAMEGRTNLIGGGNDRVGNVPKAADMAQQTPPGHTGAAPSKIGRRDEEAGESLAQRMARALMALIGLAPAMDEDAQELDEEALAQVAAENRWQRLQWLFWSLAVAGYACLVFALIVFIPGGSGFLDETRNPLGTPALIVGLISSLGAWWLARKLAANAEPAPPSESE